MEKLGLVDLIAAKSFATEVALLALLRERRDDPAFWNSLDKLAQITLNLPGLQADADPVLRAQKEAAQNFLDEWRRIAGPNPSDPAPP